MKIPDPKRCWLAALSVVSAAWAAAPAPVWAAPTRFLDFEVQEGAVTPTDASCVNPFEGCVMLISGLGTGVVSGDASRTSNWRFQAGLLLSSAADLGDGLWRARGGFAYQDLGSDQPYAGWTNLGGDYEGVFDEASFTATLGYTIGIAEGLFAGWTGTGQSVVTITMSSAGFSYNEIGRFGLERQGPAQVPLPASSALASLGLLLAAVTNGRRARRQGVQAWRGVP